MQFVYLLIGVAILIAWIGPTILITLVVIGIVGLIVYALKNNNETKQEPLANRSDNKDSKPIATTTPVVTKESSNRNIVIPIANDSFIECNQNMVGNEDIEDGTEPKDVLCVSERCNNTDMSVMLAKEEKHINDISNNNNPTMPTEEDTSHQEIYKNDKQEKIDVPMWVDTYIWSIDDLRSGTASQQRFYRYFKEQFFSGNYIDIEGNTNYAFLLMYDLSNAYRNKISLLKEYYQHLIGICPKVELYTRRILKDIIVDTKKQELKRQLAKYAGNQQEPCRWISAGEDIEVGGIKLCRGGFYIGDCFKLPKKVIDDNQYHYDRGYIYGPVINPNHPIKKGEIGNE